MFIGQLVESWSRGCGRIVALDTMFVTIKWSYLQGSTSFMPIEKAVEYYRFYNKDETEYVDKWVLFEEVK